jgi:hypothetical protein
MANEESENTSKKTVNTPISIIIKFQKVQTHFNQPESATNNPFLNENFLGL